jgi:peptidoglycan/xylan/chitin deacetylase (PgdA/CDA1 family)
VYASAASGEGGVLKKLVSIWVAFLLAFTLLSFPVTTAEAFPQTNFHTGLNGIVCLTIDDGYSRKYVKLALDVLRRKNVKCTFFVIGTQLKALADLWRQAILDGHEICYHSMRHRIMSSWSKASILNDLKQWNRTAKSVLGADYKIPKFARLPGGSGQHSLRIQKIFHQIGYKLIYWSADTYTGVIVNGTRNLNARITRYIKKSTKKNSIILTHFNCCDTPALAHYIDWLRNKFTLGKISDAFAAPAATPTPTATPAPTPPEPSSPPTSLSTDFLL